MFMIPVKLPMFTVGHLKFEVTGVIRYHFFMKISCNIKFLPREINNCILDCVFKVKCFLLGSVIVGVSHISLCCLYLSLLKMRLFIRRQLICMCC